eukprot:gene7420-9121_t
MALGIAESYSIPVFHIKYIGIQKYPFILYTIKENPPKGINFNPKAIMKKVLEKYLYFLNSVTKFILLLGIYTEDIDFNCSWALIIGSIVEELIATNLIDESNPVTNDLLHDFRVLYPQPIKSEINIFKTILNQYKISKNPIQETKNRENKLKPTPNLQFEDSPNASTNIKIVHINGKKYIAKLFNLNPNFSMSENYVSYELMEEHPNIVKIVKDGDNWEIWKLAFQIISALYHLDRNGYCHCDIKPSNILIHMINGEYQYLIADLDSLENSNDLLIRMKGTFEYQPSNLNGKPYDLYSLGITILKIIIDASLQKDLQNEKKLSNTKLEFDQIYHEMMYQIKLESAQKKMLEFQQNFENYELNLVNIKKEIESIKQTLKDLEQKRVYEKINFDFKALHKIQAQLNKILNESFQKK